MRRGGAAGGVAGRRPARPRRGGTDVAPEPSRVKPSATSTGCRSPNAQSHLQTHTNFSPSAFTSSTNYYPLYRASSI